MSKQIPLNPPLRKGETLSTAEIRVLIEEELLDTDGLAADLSAIKELALLLGNNCDCDPVRLSHLLEVVVYKADEHLQNIENLVSQLRV